MTLDAGAIHFLAGAAGGTVGAVITCPLEVVKTRLQSSNSLFKFPPTTNVPTSYIRNFSYVSPAEYARTAACTGSSCDATVILQRGRTPKPRIGLIHSLKYIIQTEGSRALFKGLGPNIVGVAPSRAVYFWAYSQSKSILNSSGFISADSPIVHILAAASAGFSSSTLTNPIWFIKTRLQLDQQANSKLTAWQCMRQIYSQHGLTGFYKGITASYYGLTETMIHFVLYEEFKSLLKDAQERRDSRKEPFLLRFFEFMGAGATSKTIATCIAYPHEVARTRLREEGSRYKTFWQTIGLVFREDGIRGLYRGLIVQLFRQIPNTAIMLATYEGVLYLYYKEYNENDVETKPEP